MTTTPKITPRKPGLVKEAAGFITGSEPAKADPPKAGAGIAPEPSAVERPTAPESASVQVAGRKATMSRRRSGKEVRQLTVYLPPDVEKQLRVVAVEEDRLPSDVVADALKMYFGAR